jgi:hypothetical protein
VLSTYSSHTEYFQTGALPTSESFPPFWVFDLEHVFEVRFGDENWDYFRISGELTDVHVVPEPGTVVLFGLGVLAAARRRRARVLKW